ncbi:MAG: hypothetical protein ACR2LY_05010 [Thermoleophilaceae bacterium]
MRRRPGSSGEPVPPVDVPRLAFTEAMRDIDLFVGVCSVGNDPAWRDRGEAPQFDEYWVDYSFGGLGEQARTRGEVLERLLPKLRIADRCRIDGRFLRFEGKLRTYRIHLGSSNILMGRAISTSASFGTACPRSSEPSFPSRATRRWR